MRGGGAIAAAGRRRGASAVSYRRGVNLAGPEYGCGNSVETNTGSGAFSYSSIGTYGNQFIYPSSADLSYMATQLGPAPIFRFNVRIERLMTGPGAGFRTAEQARVQTLLDNAQTAGAGVILAPWNFGAVWNPTRQAVGSAGFSTAQFADFWSRVVTQWGSHPAFLAADLMTEPVGVTGGASGWQTAAQAAVDAIRAVNTNLWIWVPTYDYQIHTVTADHPGGPWITDSTGNFGYTQHQYAYNMGGSEYDYTNCLNTAIGDGWTAAGNTDALHTRELAGITTYKNWVGNHKVYIGEYGCPNPGNPLVSGTDAPKWLALWQRLLTEYDANGWWATAWTSGSAVDVTDPNEMYCTYYASGGWDTAVNSRSGTASQTEAHPSVL